MIDNATQCSLPIFLFRCLISMGFERIRLVKDAVRFAKQKEERDSLHETAKCAHKSDVAPCVRLAASCKAVSCNSIPSTRSLLTLLIMEISRIERKEKVSSAPLRDTGNSVSGYTCQRWCCPNI